MTVPRKTFRFLLALCAMVLTGAALASEPLALRLYSFEREPQRADRGLQQAVEWLALGQRKQARQVSVCRSSYDAYGLVFFLDLEETSPSVSDSVEVWLLPPGQSTYWQYILQRNGALTSYRSTETGAELASLSGETASATETRKGWSAVLRIPFSSLAVSPPKDNERWKFNVCRHWKGRDGGEELSSWAALGRFNHLARFGELVFYSKADVDADLAYWEGQSEDPHLRRSRVSGLAVVRQSPEQTLSFWQYDPFAADREAAARWGQQGLTNRASAEALGRPQSAESDYPGVYRTADRLNRAILRLSQTRLRLDELYRIKSYGAASGGEELEGNYVALKERLEGLYVRYATLFPSREPEAWKPLQEAVEAFSSEVATLHGAADRQREHWQAEARGEREWTPPLPMLEAQDERRNENGAPTRFWFSSYGLYGTEPAADYLGPFRSHHIYGPFLLLDRDAEGNWSIPGLPLVDQRIKPPEMKLNSQTMVGQVSYQGPTSEWLEARIEKDPEMLAVTQDHIDIPRQQVGSIDFYMRRGVNISHPETQRYYRDYLAQLTRTLKERLDFVVTGWEDRTELRHWHDGKVVTRTRGYDSHSKADFRKTLKERYGSIEALNRRWGGAPYGSYGSYASFEEIEPPADRWLSGPGKADGLHYEWARWQITSHMGWSALLRAAIRAEAPQLPVMTDSSHLLLYGTGWRALEAETADILSFHYNPANEEAIFAYLQSIARRKGVPLGCFEHYEMMYSRLDGDDEELGARGVRRHFYDLTARDVRHQGSWLRYMAHATPYIAAYGGAVFRVDTDQTILRWASTEIARYRHQVAAVERAMVESTPEKGRIGVFLPDSTFLQTCNLQKPEDEEVPMRRFIRFQNSILSAGSLAAEYLHEEMLESAGDELEDYKVIVVLDAAFVSETVLAKLAAWAGQPGRTLLISGPLGFFDSCGLPLPQEASPQRVAFPELSLVKERPWQLATARLPSGKPWLQHAAFKDGKVVQMMQPLAAFLEDPEKRDSLIRLLGRAAPRRVAVEGREIRHHLREGKNGRRYLLLSNRDSREAQRYEITFPEAEGEAVAVADVALPGGYPLTPSTDHNGSTIFRGALQPGDWTLLDLGPSPDSHVR